MSACYVHITSVTMFVLLFSTLKLYLTSIFHNTTLSFLTEDCESLIQLKTVKFSLCGSFHLIRALKQK